MTTCCTTTTTTTYTTTTTTTTTTTEEPTTTTTTTTTGKQDEATVETAAEVGYYFSVDTRSFSDLYGISVSNGSADKVTFRYDGTTYKTPAAMFDALGEAYVGTTLDIYYDGKDTGNDVTVYIGVKGDANLNGEVEISDANAALVYYAQHAAGNDETFSNLTSNDSSLETLMYFLTDVDTESTAGKDSGDDSLSIMDANYILVYYAQDAAGNKPEWTTLIPSLTSLEGSIWA